MRALKENPALRVFRKQRAVAEGEIVSATALSNPLLQIQMVHFQEAANMGFTAQLKWTPPQPVEYLAKRGQARANLSAVQYEIAEQEWALAAAVRVAHFTLLELRDQVRLLNDSLQLRRRMAVLIRERVAHGAATRLEQNLVELSILYSQRELNDTELRRTLLQSQLQGLLGMLSAQPLQVRGPMLEAPEGSAALDAEALAEQAVANRPGLKAANARILQRQEALRLEKTRRWPWPEISGRYGQTGSAKYPNDWQVGVQLPLPVLNLNGGPIQVASAELEREQASQQAQVQALKQSVFAACAELKQRSEILAHYRRNVLPILSEHNRLLELAVRGGQVELSALLSSEEGVVRGQREFSEARLNYRRAWLMLAATIGTSVKELAR